MTDPAQNPRRAREYLAAIEAGAVEFPHRLTPEGATRRIEDILAAAERGREVLKHTALLRALVNPDRIFD
jgi:hypothetical protein